MKIMKIAPAGEGYWGIPTSESTYLHTGNIIFSLECQVRPDSIMECFIVTPDGKFIREVVSMRLWEAL